MLLARSAPEGEADEIAMNPDIDTRRSAVGGKADVPATWPGSPLLASSGRSPHGSLRQVSLVKLIAFPYHSGKGDEKDGTLSLRDSCCR